MEENRAGWLPHLSKEVVSHVEGNLLDAYAVSLEGWRRGLTLRWHVKDSEMFSEMTTWYVDRPGQLFSLTSKERTHYFFRTRGDKVTNHAVEIGKNKEKTKQVIQNQGIAVPSGKHFDKDQSDESIFNYVHLIGYPVVLKPTNGSFGRGVITNIRNNEELEDALIYVRAELSYKDVVVEQYIPGREYRIYVVGDRVVGAINRIPPNVIGDGKNSLHTLINKKNKERAKNPRLISCPITINQELETFIDRKGYSLASILEKGERIFLNEKSNVSTGGDPVDVLDELPDEIKTTAVKALKAVQGLEHGAVDLIIHPDRALAEAGVVLELNPTAQIGGLLYPIQGKARDIPGEIIDYYFPETKTDGHRKPNIYFGLQEVLTPLSNKTARITEVASIVPSQLYGKKCTIIGEVDHDYFRLRKAALDRDLSGSIYKIKDNKTEVVIAGFDEVHVDHFKDVVNDIYSSERLDVREETWEQPVKLGFHIHGDMDEMLTTLQAMQKDLAQSKREKKILEKQYRKMLNSRIWRVTGPLRKLSSFVKKKIKS
ncbi:ATP-grasp domain-containing protein [Shouchella shacheensis]|uniref:ATP-grasp domain-containing protein n=1 Tax=Shouchella shacheensis TaxID=1649580 RepID=UPI0007404E3A|nr:ATP-grasp domain-containing protein [Shouchella shacheensis]